MGPYIGGLYNTDTFSEDVDDTLVEGAYTWTDLLIGALIKYSFPTGGPWRPWISVAPGFGVLSSTTKYFGDSWTFENDNRNTGGFGLDVGAGVDYRFLETITVGFGVRFHINTADTVEYDLYGETYEWELKESPVGFGVGLDVGVSL